MKSKITLIIVCLLCFVLVLPSCDGAGEQKTEDTNLSETESKTTVDSEQTTEEQTTEEQTTEEIEVDYSKFVFNGGNLVEFYEKYGSYSVTVDNKEDFVEAWDLIRDIDDLDIYI